MPRDGDGVFTLAHDLVADKEATPPVPPSAERFQEILDDIAAQINDLEPASDITAQLAGKANAADVDAALAAKANTSDVTTALETKANTSDMTTALSGKVDTSALGSTVATLTGGYLSSSQIPPSITSPFRFRGTWNAETNATSPVGGGSSGTLASGVGTEGDLWRVSVAGTTSLDGNANWTVGDELYFGGGVWNPLGSSVGTSQSDGRIVGFFGNPGGQSGVSLRGFWTADNRIFQVGLGTSSGNGDETGSNNWLPIQIPWDATLGISSIVTGLASHYLIDENGAVWSWGGNSVGQLGHGDTTDRARPEKITALDGIVIAEVIPSVVNGGNYAAAFFREATSGGTGRVWGCGHGTNYVFGNSSTSNQSTPVRIGTLTNVVEVAFANNDAPAFFRTSEPGIYVTGGPSGNANGIGTGAEAQTPMRLTTLDNEDISKIAVGGGASEAVAVMLKANGAPLICGTGTYGLGFGNTTTLTAFTEITVRPDGESYDDVAVVGGSCLVAFRSTVGNLHILGYGGTGVRGNGSTSDMTSIVKPAGAFQGDVDEIAVGGPDGNQIVAVRCGNVLWACGDENVGQSGQGVYNRAAADRVWGEVVGLDGVISSWGFNGAAATAGLTVVLADGRVKACGGNSVGETGTQPGNLHAVTTLQTVQGLPSYETSGRAQAAADAAASESAAAAASSVSAAASEASAAAAVSASALSAAAASAAAIAASSSAATAAAAAAVLGAHIYTTKASADADIGNRSNGDFIVVVTDETRANTITLYQKSAGAYVFLRELSDMSISSLYDLLGYSGRMRNTLNTLSLMDDGLIGRYGYAGADLIPLSITASQSGTTVTATTAVFQKLYVGCVIRWTSGEEAVITDINNSGSSYAAITTCTVDRSQTVSSGSATINAKHLVGCLFGDSLGLRISAPLSRHLWRSLGFGGYVLTPLNVESNFNAQIATIAFAGGAAETSDLLNFGSYPWSAWWSVPSGGSFTASLLNKTYVGVDAGARHGLNTEDTKHDTMVVAWKRGAGSFTVERKRYYDAAWEAVDTIADASTGSRVYNFKKYTHALGSGWQYRIAGTSGTVAFVALAFFNNTSPGYVSWPVTRGSLLASQFDALPSASLSELCQILGQPDFRWSLFSDPVAGQTSTSYYAPLVAADRALWASAAPSCDLIWTQVWDQSASNTEQHALNASTRSLAISNGDTYIALADLFGDFSTVGSKIGYLTDGIHTTQKAESQLAHKLLRAIGLSDHPAVRSGRDVDAKAGAFSALQIRRRDVRTDMQRSAQGMVSGGRGAKWDRANTYLRGLNCLSSALGSSDFTIALDFEVQASASGTQYLFVANGTSGAPNAVSSIEVVSNGAYLNVTLRDGSGVTYLYQYYRMGVAYPGRHIVHLRSNRAQNWFDVFVDGFPAYGIDLVASGSGASIGSWVGVGTDISIPGASGYQYPVYGLMVWPRALTDAEVGDTGTLFDAGATAPDLWWDFSVGVGRVVRDRTGNGRHGMFTSSNPAVMYLLTATPTWLKKSDASLGPLWVTGGNYSTNLIPGDDVLVKFSSNIDVTLPAAPSVGDVIRVTKATTSVVKVGQAALHQIKTGAGTTVGTDATTIGTGGKLNPQANGSVTLVCTRADAGVAYEWALIASQGTLTWT